MNNAPPMPFVWDGEAMVPAKPRLADRYYVVGESYQLVPEEDRSRASHNHEFAWLAQAWMNLPENLADMYASPEHLRKRALIEAGYYNEEIVDAGNKAGALRVAAAFRKREEFSLVIVRGPLVIIRSPKSQSRRAMKRAEFEDSKAKILAIVSAMVGVEPGALVKARAA